MPIRRLPDALLANSQARAPGLDTDRPADNQMPPRLCWRRHARTLLPFSPVAFKASVWRFISAISSALETCRRAGGRVAVDAAAERVTAGSSASACSMSTLGGCGRCCSTACACSAISKKTSSSSVRAGGAPAARAGGALLGRTDMSAQARCCLGRAWPSSVTPGSAARRFAGDSVASGLTEAGSGLACGVNAEGGVVGGEFGMVNLGAARREGAGCRRVTAGSHESRDRTAHSP
jgi:hypothetical protein